MHEIKCPNCGKAFTIDEAGFASILKQVRDEEFNKDLSERLHQFEREKQAALTLAASQAEQSKATALAQQQKQISELNIKVMELQKDKELAVAQAVAKIQTEMADKDKKIVELNGLVATTKQQGALDVQSLKNDYEAQLRVKDAEIALHKDMKTKMSTKMVGETLEQHCSIEFERLRATAFQHAEFGKDNDASSGSKGDFIFRDYDEDGKEYISIMFEMKNESDATASKHKNEHFFKELDKDRTEKKCEYAVLVSLLEQDNELYNGGIVDVSHKYDKMYVIRPQCFIPMITLLRNAAQKSIEYKREITRLERTSIDVSNFETSMNAFKEGFSRNCKDAGDRYEEAIKNIDDIIKKLEKTKDALRLWNKHLGTAANKLEDLTIKKLTRDNPTMAAKFAAARTVPDDGADN